jgi:hypothetical protein
MDIGPVLERHPQLEEICRQQISFIHKDIIGADPLEEVQDYINNINSEENKEKRK